jgi:hypothetical protein
MTREGLFCAWLPCGGRNPRQSHWHIGGKRFCCGAHYRLYADSDVAERSAPPRYPGTLQHGVSPRPR